MKTAKLLFFIVLCVTFASCGSSSSLTRGEQYSKFYEEKPLVILVMPPINNTTCVDVKEFLYTSISRPLVEMGYYVVSPHLAMDIFKAESAYDAEMFVEQNVGMFGQVFGADAVIFTTIDKWEKQGFGIETDISYVIKSTHTNEILFDRSCEYFLDCTVDSGNSSLVGQLISVTATLINTAVTDNIVAARKCNSFSLTDLPRGKYNPLYQLDQEEKALEKEMKARVK